MVDPAIVLAPFAAGMAIATAFLIKWAADTRTPLRASAVVFLLVMMVAMFAGLAVYFAIPSLSAAIEGLWVASALMSASVVLVFLGLREELRQRAAAEKSGTVVGLRNPHLFAGAVIGLVLANELLMGWTFQAAAGEAIALFGGGAGGFLAGLAAVVTSPWFLFTMAGEMLLTALLLRDRLPRPVLAVLLAQSVIMVLSPPALASAGWATVSVYLSSAVMIGLFVFLMEHLYRNRALLPAFSTYIWRLLAVYGVMMAGLFVWFAYGSLGLFALSVVLEMILYFDLVVRPGRLSDGEPVPWQLRPGWAVGVLGGIFVAEVFMGALLSAQILGATFTGSLPALPLTGPPATVLYNAVYNGFWFLALTTASTWFLAMMGVEMGALVYFKYRETTHRETKIRLLLMLGCYGAFAVFFPSVYYSLLLPSLPSGTEVPVLGWSMGVGSAPLALGVFGVLLATYAIAGAFTFLFGRRAVCSTFCTAAVMYQGTTIDSMKSFNHSSPLARKFLSSRFSSVYSLTMGVVMVSFFLACAASYLTQAGVWSVTILGADPTVFFLAFYFGVLWYVLFVTIPYAGNYNCVTMGWCYTGIISGAIGRLGPFRLKVRSKEVCRACTTLDCARSCPVGLVDMPGHFRQKGEFRSSKCCGVGDCIQACPHDNMYIYDARHWFREKLGFPARPAPARLPMLTRPASTPVGLSAPHTPSAPGTVAGTAAPQ